MDGNVRGIADTSDDVEGESAPALTKLDAIGKVTKVITKGRHDGDGGAHLGHAQHAGEQEHDGGAEDDADLSVRLRFR